MISYPLNICACFTGHRIVKENFEVSVLDAEIKNLLDKGVRVFLDGMAMGFDTLCFNRLLEFKKEYKDIKIIACVPCKNQPKSFPAKDREEYQRLISLSDEVVLLQENYSPYCMNKRNRFMVDNSDYCIAYVYKTKSGSYYTASYAEERKKTVIYVK